jgi:hypothetical protein
MLMIFILNIYYSISRLFNCITPNIYAYHAHNTHYISIVTKFWLHMQLMDHGGLFMDEYNPKNIHIGG